MRLFPIPLALCTAAALAVGCSESMLSGPASEEDVPPRQSETVRTATYELTGRVATIHGAPIAGVEVQVGTRVRTTDQDGLFAARLPVDETVQVFARKDGWTEGHRRLLPTDQTQVAVEVALLPTHSMHLQSAADGGRVAGELGVVLEFPPNAFVNAVGSPYSGPVEVEYALLDTARSIVAAPGDMTARVDGEETALESFGMVEVDFFDATGNPVTFVGESARLEIPASDTHDFADGDAIVMWTFDEDSGVWLEEGSGYYENDTIVATVPHFSWWNCDQPTRTSCIVGTLDLGDLGHGVTVSTTGVDYRGSETRSVETDGSFCVNAARGRLMDFRIERIAPSENPEVLVVPAMVAPTAQGTCRRDRTACVDLGDLSMEPPPDLDGDGSYDGFGDCDDDNPTISPLAVEICNGIDDDCDGAVDESSPDADADGWTQCNDCDDSDPSIHPTAEPTCDAQDSDCDGAVDSLHLDGDGDGLSRCEGDCDDADATLLNQCSYPLISLSATQGCAVRASGPVCWGINAVPVPAEATSVQGIAAGHSTTCGVQVGAGAQCWGQQELTLPNLDTAFGEFDDIVVGDTHVCAMRLTGRSECWGSPAGGRLDVPDTWFLDLAAGSSFTCGVRNTGRVACWGAMAPELEPPITLTTAVSVDVSDRAACAVTDAGAVHCWGDLGGPELAPLPTFTAVAVGDAHACAQMEDGRLHCWGDDTHGQTQAPGYAFVDFAASGATTCGIRANDQVHCWGRDVNGTAQPPQ